MKLSEKIAALRKQNGMTQEELAELCHVSRQSISKWEADIALPEADKLLTLSERFRVSLDVLLKDDLALSLATDARTCGQNAVRPHTPAVYEGILIKESVDDDSILDLMRIHKMQLSRAGGTPAYWTMLHFTCDAPDFPQRLSQVMIADPARGGNWFCDFKAGNEKYIVFRDKILRYSIGNATQRAAVCEECRRLGITDNEMQWPE